MIITFHKWDEYQKDNKRYKYTTWFAINNKLWQSTLWDALSGDEIKGFLFLLCQVSQRAHKTGELEMTPRTFNRLSGLSVKVFSSLIDALQAHGVCTVQSPCENGNARGENGNARGENRVTKQNKTIQNPAPCVIPDIQKLWNNNKHHDQPNASPLSTDQSRKWGARWKAKPDEAYWIEIIRRVAGSEFCRGGKGGEGWITSLDWLLKNDANHKKIFDGQLGCKPASKTRESDPWV